MPTIKYTVDADYDEANSQVANFRSDIVFYSIVRPDNTQSDSRFQIIGRDSNTRIANDYVKKQDGTFLLPTTGGVSIDFSDNNRLRMTLTGGDFGDVIRGGSQDDTLNGGGGNDVLEGGAGADTFEGGDGSDTVSYEHSTNRVSVVLSPGFIGRGGDAEGDTYQDIENLRGSDVVSGDAIDDQLAGNASRNIIEGGKGADQIGGEGGGDVASYEHSSAGVIVNLTTSINSGGDAQGDQLSNIRDLLGSASADDLTGDEQNNTLDGGAGADTLTGLAGNDTYVVDNEGDVVVEADAPGVDNGTDTVLTSISWALTEGQSIETLRLLNSTTNENLNLTGNEFDQRLIGNAGNNVLDGGAGADTMTGGKGADTYYVDNVRDHTVESVGGGTDTVIASVSYNLDAGREIETLKAGANAGDINIGGNTLSNTLIGNDGDNRLNGRGGEDTFQGGKGDDTYTTDGDDTLIETTDGTGGFDTVISTGVSFRLGEGVGIEKLQIAGSAPDKGASFLYGNELDQRLIGNAGANVLDGGLGNDVLQGGAGSDTFLFSTTLGSNNIDHIRDFNAGQDQILLATNIFSEVTTDETGRLAADEFVDIGGGNTVDGDDSIAYNSKTGALFYVTHDGSGAHLQQFAVLDTHPALTNLNFGVPVIE